MGLLIIYVVLTLVFIGLVYHMIFIKQKSHKRIIIMGGGGSGKDYLKNKLINRGFRPEISYTTRPIREGEVDGVTYHYVTKKNFLNMAKHNSFVQYKNFRSWWYGTHKNDWNNKDIFIMTPEGLETLTKKDRSSSFVIFIDIAEDIRRKRLEKRNDADDVQRRLKADREQFENLTDYDMIIKNPEF